MTLIHRTVGKFLAIFRFQRNRLISSIYFVIYHQTVSDGAVWRWWLLWKQKLDFGEGYGTITKPWGGESVSLLGAKTI